MSSTRLALAVAIVAAVAACGRAPAVTGPTVVCSQSLPTWTAAATPGQYTEEYPALFSGPAPCPSGMTLQTVLPAPTGPTRPLPSTTFLLASPSP